MSWKQRNFFTSSGWENVEIPLELGGKEGSVLYVAHNADTDYIKSNLVKLWEIWLERALI